MPRSPRWDLIGTKSRAPWHSQPGLAYTLLLNGTRNKVGNAFISWGWDYFSKDRAPRGRSTRRHPLSTGGTTTENDPMTDGAPYLDKGSVAMVGRDGSAGSNSSKPMCS